MTEFKSEFSHYIIAYSMKNRYSFSDLHFVYIRIHIIFQCLPSDKLKMNNINIVPMCSELTMAEMRQSLEQERERIVTEVKKQMEVEKQQAVDETKRSSGVQTAERRPFSTVAGTPATATIPANKHTGLST